MPSHLSVVILAAGLGTRMKSKKAKVLHRAGGLSLIEHVIDAALGLTEAENIVAVVGHQADEVRAEVEGRGIRFQVQPDPHGTGHALLQCAGLAGLGRGHLLVIYGDCPLLRPETLRRLVETHRESGATTTLVTTLLDDPTGYGRIIKDAGGAVEAIIEEKAATPDQKKIREINAGIYCFDADALWPRLAALPPNPASGEIYLTDIAEALRRDGLHVAPLRVDDPRELLGINNRAELAEVDLILRRRKAQELMESGVTLQQPDTITIDAKVEIGPDTIVEPYTRLLGRTKIGADCYVGAYSVVDDTVLDDGASVLPHCFLEESHLEHGSSVGPYARLRPGSHVEENAHVGNFVELKKTRLGAGSKAMHLAYLGDSTIGRKTNIGAGTILCNYDGVAKHKTTIGDGVFVGSNSTLVAPVEVGEGSYIAAGSVVTQAVPPDALAIGRSRQVNKEGWAKQRRQKLKGPTRS
jgi:bifunctional UDP-N-acetylglucosamine pyrophosphorylase / glucosamine-1-phosphate N-acetyltransferase